MTCPSIPDPVRRVHLKTALATVTTAAIASLGMASLARADPVPFDPSRYAGRIVYLDFWASWCPPCLQSFPWMAQITERYAARGLAVVAVNLDRDRGAADRFLSRAAPTFEIVFDPKGRREGLPAECDAEFVPAGPGEPDRPSARRLQGRRSG